MSESCATEFKALLIDCGEGGVAAVLPPLGIAAVDAIWFTHHHRDQACGVHAGFRAGARICVPAEERACFDNMSAYWQDPKNRWHLYGQHPDHLMLAESMKVDDELSTASDGRRDRRKSPRSARPGIPTVSLSYLVEADGKRVVFSRRRHLRRGPAMGPVEPAEARRGTVAGATTTVSGDRPQLARVLGGSKRLSPICSCLRTAKS